MADALKLPEPKLWTLGAPADGKVLTSIKPTAYGRVPIFTAGQVADAILAERERCARVVPTSWLDSLMVMKVPAGCPEIESLCRRIAAAIRDGNAGVTAVQPQQAVQCAFCERSMLAGSECLKADQAATCEARAAGVPACAEPLPQRYTAGDIMQVISEYGTARYSEGVNDALNRGQLAVESHSAAKDRFNDLRLMLDAFGVSRPDHQTFSQQTPMDESKAE